MTRRRASALLVAATAAAAVTAGTARADLAQTPIATGCPAGFDRMSVAWLESVGAYRLPRRLDTTGNGDGYVCGLALPDAVRIAMCGTDCDVPVLYEFAEDDNPASTHAQAGE